MTWSCSHINIKRDNLFPGHIENNNHIWPLHPSHSMFRLHVRARKKRRLMDQGALFRAAIAAGHPRRVRQSPKEGSVKSCLPGTHRPLLGSGAGPWAGRWWVLPGWGATAGSRWEPSRRCGSWLPARLWPWACSCPPAAFPRWLFPQSPAPGPLPCSCWSWRQHWLLPGRETPH